MRLYVNIIYIHGLDSDANSTKGLLLERYCQQYHPDINVVRPDLNKSPAQVFEQLVFLIETLDSDENKKVKNIKDISNHKNTVLVGSSLGGYFSTLVGNHTGCPALLLNPSTQPHITLQRFSDDNWLDSKNSPLTDRVLHKTAGGWSITQSDLQWFADHQLSEVNYPEKIAVFIKEGDELLNPELSKAFYQKQGSVVTLQAGGDHRFSDFDKQLPNIIVKLKQLLQN